MNPYLEKVKLFHEKFKLYVGDVPQIPYTQTALRLNLIREEFKELEEGVHTNDLLECLDALCDIQYVLSGAILAFGMHEIFDEAFDEVQRSNMSKACANLVEVEQTKGFYLAQDVESYEVQNEDGTWNVYRSSDAKLLKNVNYSPANLAQFLLR